MTMLHAHALRVDIRLFVLSCSLMPQGQERAMDQAAVSRSFRHNVSQGSQL